MAEPDGVPQPLVTIDFCERVKVARADYFNELRSLRTLHTGMRRLCEMVKRPEAAFETATGGKVKMFSFGGASPDEDKFLDAVACFFHWFGISACNYVRLVGFIRGLSLGHFSRADLKDTTKFKSIKSVIDDYVEGIAELESVRIWRNKVFAHFAITDPYKDDNIATLDMSVIFPVTFEGRYVVGGLTLRRSNPAGSHVSQLPRWSMTEVFESLAPRFWPGTKWEAPRPEENDQEGSCPSNT